MDQAEARLDWPRERGAVAGRFRRIRGDSERLCAPLATEDYVVQTIAEASPAKWHLAHVTWFFETFLLRPFAAGHQPFDPAFEYLFNSYYNSVGGQWPRARRGELSRPTVATVYRYRAQADEAMLELLEGCSETDWPEIAWRTELGLAHEQQHQELLLTDLKQNLSVNPLYPPYRKELQTADGGASEPEWVEFAAGETGVGYNGGGFAFDNEMPRHRVLVEDFRLASRSVTNGEFVGFVEEGGYDEPMLWLSDGWAVRSERQWQAPLHWRRIDGEWFEFTLGGLRPLNVAAPVSHVSYYEADAFARWSGKRLPSEQEWEHAAAGYPVEGNFRDTDLLHPRPAVGTGGLQQLFGDVWEWTRSPYTPYPGYTQGPGAFGEYNGKFMCNQLVVRGGSCVTPLEHIRLTYRNFFYPSDRWQFLGIRLAEDA